MPVQAEYYALEGLAQLLETVDLVRARLNPRSRLLGVVVTMLDARTRLGKEVAAEVRSHLGSQAFETVIPRNVRLGEAPSFGKPISRYDRDLRGFRRILRPGERGGLAWLRRSASGAACRRSSASGRGGGRGPGAEPVAGAREDRRHLRGRDRAGAAGESRLRDLPVADIAPRRGSRGAASTRPSCRSWPTRSAVWAWCSRSWCGRAGRRRGALGAHRRRTASGASRIAGLETVPALVRSADEAAALEIALAENVAREDLNAIEEAHAFAALADEFGLTHERIGELVGQSRVAVTNVLRLLELPDDVQLMIETGELTEGHGRALLALSDHGARRKLARPVVRAGTDRAPDRGAGAQGERGRRRRRGVRRGRRAAAPSAATTTSSTNSTDCSSCRCASTPPSAAAASRCASRIGPSSSACSGAAATRRVGCRGRRASHLSRRRSLNRPRTL